MKISISEHIDNQIKYYQDIIDEYELYNKNLPEVINNPYDGHCMYKTRPRNQKYDEMDIKKCEGALEALTSLRDMLTDTRTFIVIYERKE